MNTQQISRNTRPSRFRPRLWSAIGFAAGTTCLTVGAATSQTAPPTPASPQATFFENKIRPLLVNNCYGCHGPSTQLAGLRVDSLSALQKGGTSGAAIVPGDPNKSLLIQAVLQTGSVKMPKGGKLKREEIADLEAWVKMGAPWPQDPVNEKKVAGSFWSLQPVKKPALPKVINKAWIRQPIDAFILTELEAKKLSPAPVADPRTLLRRVTYDLTGLPPTAEEMDAYLADTSADKYEKAVDRLLASPHYGERWARRWLDVARYADTKGYVFEEDRNYYNAYTYRDWVINAFNKDLPYDQFIVQQLAADRLPEVQNGEDKRPLAALGFLTVGRRFLNSTPDIIDDRIDVTMRGFQGFTVACARCHDHKFDPIPTQDYYSLYGVFASSVETETPISEKSISEPWASYSQKVATTERAIHDLTLGQTKLLRKKMPGLGDDLKGILQSLRDEQAPEGANLAKLSESFDPTERDHLRKLQQDLDVMKKKAPPKPEFAMAMADNNNCSDGVVFKRGNPGNQGEAAPRRFLLALSKPGEERTHWTAGSGRLELAKAIASRDNPLTARVFVNRMWQEHFGVGIVRTASDFGHQGERPTNPALLDYLAATFMESGWSIKKLHKLIVTSATYRQASFTTPKALNADPDNKELGRMNRRRLDLEQMRDSLMFVAGKLDVSHVGGKSVDLWSEPFTRRRAVYGFVDRQNLPGVFRTFDFASPDSTSPRRFQTTVPQQALFLMNSPFSVDAARAVAERPEIQSSKGDGQRIRRLYRLLFERMPDANETAMGVAYLKEGANSGVESPLSVWKYGYGSFDQGRVTSFTPFATFADGGYRVGKTYPDPKLGYVAINSVGGHPGHDGQHSAVRRWTAPADMKIQVTGTLAHRQKEGDGVRGRIVSSRLGLLGEWQAHGSEAKTDVASIVVHKGETIDFVLDPIATDAYDSFSWAPVIRTIDAKQTWDAAANFGPPSGPELTKLALYAQALMMTNEFMFID